MARQGRPRAQSNFDPEAYLRAIDTKDFLRLVITGHLYIEAVLIELLKRRLPAQERRAVEDVRFVQLVDRAIALGALLPSERKPFDLLNQLRNKVAHERGHVVTMGDV